MWAYSMVALGFINWDYQRSNAHSARNSFLIIVPGLLLLALTFWPKAKPVLEQRATRFVWGLIGAAAIIFAFTNK